MRRTASLSIFAEEKENNLANIDHLFSINKKCILELGIINNVPDYIYSEFNEDNIIKYTTINYKQKYGNIIWFPLGVYVMFNPSISHSDQGITISMQLKDKMCLLNGDLGGEIHSAIDFSSQDQQVDIDSVSVDKKQVLIYNIIKELVNHWGNEDLNKIIISEVPLQIKQVVKWIGSDPVYFVKLENQDHGYMLYKTQEEVVGTIEKIYKTNQDIGFIYTDFTYPGQLCCNAGDTVTSVLDKLIGVMGNYEYFYDVYGNFRFQEKQNYLNMTNTAYWSKQMMNIRNNNEKFIADLPTQVYEADNYRLSKVVYNFTNNQYTTAYNNSLNYNNVKNDFVVWGSYPVTSNSNNRIPCRFHLAIDKKPSLNTHKIVLFQDSNQVTRAVAAKGTEENIITVTSVDWREEIYYQMLEDEKNGTGQNTELNNTYFQYYAQLKEQFPKIFFFFLQEYIIDTIGEHPDIIPYYLDFIDQNSELGQYSVSNIGRRAKIIDGNNQKINCVFEPYINDIVFIDTSQYTDSEYDNLKKQLNYYGQNWTQIPHDIAVNFATGGVYNSCFEKIKDLLYQYTHINNTISITSLPIYYLEPNTRITVEDKPAGIYGDYIIQSISLPLDVSSTMTINAYKAEQKI